jgi:lipopolysaccharide transport system permease protein
MTEAQVQRARVESVSAFADVVLALTESDLRHRYGRGPWLIPKWLIEPFAALGIYLLLVGFILDRSSDNLGLAIACAVVPFQLIVSTVANAMGAVATRRSVILNMGFPRTLIPLASTMVETVAFSTALLILPVLMVAYDVAPTTALLWVPIILAQTILVAAAFAFPFSLFGVWFPDLRSFGVSAVRTLFFVSSGLVPLTELSGTTHTLLVLNPLTGVFEAYRDVFAYGRAPLAWHVLYPIACALVLLAAFVPLYEREQRQFAKVVD